MWNRVFHDVDEVRYPDALKSTLVQVRELVDIVLPGLDDSNTDSAVQAQAQRDAFMHTQDDMNVLNVSDLRSSSFRDQVRLVPSGSPAVSSVSPLATSANHEALLSSRGKTRRTKLRHEDSQIQFQPIESSPSAKQQESQVLTDRQMEVRERQREEGAMYDIRSSSPLHRVSARQEEEEEEEAESPALPKTSDETPKKSTPGPQREYEDYISSTPTPRRGNALPLDNDVEMSDPPSSPPEVPEVRRYPLADEIRSRSNSKNQMPPWDFSSSPVSGSPLPQHRVIVPEQEVEADGDMGMMHDDLDDSRAQESVVEDSFNMDVVPSSAPAASTRASHIPEQKEMTAESVRVNKAKSNPSTPSPVPRRKTQETPRSENDEFVDALTSPVLQEGTPSRRRGMRMRSSPGNVTEYAISTGAERSMMRVADEAVAQQAKTRSLASSPATPRTRSTRKRKVEAQVLDCITVATSGQEDEDGASGDEVIPATPEENTSSLVSAKLGPGRPPKRKRGASKSLDKRPGRPKRRRSTEDCSQTSRSRTSPVASSRQQPSVAASLEEQAAQIVNRPKEPEDEVQSQLMSEHIAASQSQSRASPEISDDAVPSPPRPMEIEMAMRDQMEDAAAEDAMAPMASEPSPAASKSTKPKKPAAVRIEGHMLKAMDKLRGTALTREEMNRIEDLFIDFKRELYDAEQRGRNEDNLRPPGTG